ncbi:MFS transporter [Lentilactobacillus sp. Marseille-Q4993]|uniref:MFS transporter n=1 Tax=Lentilactobacillus sp. Marseille-Q4993 TaxID=3039492 RepID=UPI0024BC1E2B|nr:MFS transporter [Lentilactobacillus sp. Marseille-Q4993]
MKNNQQLFSMSDEVTGEINIDRLSPDTGKPLPTSSIIRYLIAFSLFSILNAAAFNINGTNLLPQHLSNVGFMDPTSAFSVITSVTSVVSMFAGYLWGNLSDHTKSRFGKRTPWIFWGAIVAGIGLYLIGSFATVTSITLAYCFNTLGQNAIQTPMYAIMADRIPQRVRGTLATGLMASSIGIPIGQMISSNYIDTIHQGMGFFIGAVFITLSGILPLLIMPRERASHREDIPSELTIKSLLPPSIDDNRDFYKAAVARFLIMIGYTMVMQYLLYILENYIGQSTAEAGRTLKQISVATLFISLIGLIIAGPVSDYLKRRKLPILVGVIIMIVGAAVPIIFKSTTGIIVYAVLTSLGNGIYVSVDMALNIDVIPREAKVKKNTGMYIGLINFANTLGLMVAPLLTGMTLSVTTSYGMVFMSSMLFAAIGVIFILSIRNIN